MKEAMMRLAAGDLGRSDALLSGTPPSDLSKAIPGEWLGLRALIRAPSRPPKDVQVDIDAARESLPYIDARDFAELASVILELRDGAPGAVKSSADSVARVLSTGHRDAVVHAVRAFPPMIRAIIDADPTLEDELTQLLASSRDVALGRATGLKMPREKRQQDDLSPRERDVYELIRAGRTNPEIAAALFISNSTVKVHVRHIYEKLGVHSRAEAAAIGREGS
jgi:DNA-binding NarL/FixJ family response regulator